jgi:hypothetical protein
LSTTSGSTSPVRRSSLYEQRRASSIACSHRGWITLRSSERRWAMPSSTEPDHFVLLQIADHLGSCVIGAHHMPAGVGKAAAQRRSAIARAAPVLMAPTHITNTHEPGIDATPQRKSFGREAAAFLARPLRFTAVAAPRPLCTASSDSPSRDARACLMPGVTIPRIESIIEPVTGRLSSAPQDAPRTSCARSCRAGRSLEVPR